MEILGSKGSGEIWGVQDLGRIWDLGVGGSIFWFLGVSGSSIFHILCVFFHVFSKFVFVSAF